MKKAVFFVLSLALIFGFTASSFAGGGGIIVDGYTGRNVFAIDGEFIAFIPYSFIVPSGNCGNVRTFEYIPSYSYSSPAHWEELEPGSEVVSYSMGMFKFKVDGKSCTPEFTIIGEIMETDLSDAWSGMEQNPEDLGVLIKEAGIAGNYLNLSTDDSKFSYVIAFPRYGTKNTLDQLIDFASNGNGGIQPAGSDLVGAIVPNERGYLSKAIFYPRNLEKSKKILANISKNIMIDDDQVVILIYKGNYSY
jgi:hypothetical protein